MTKTSFASLNQDVTWFSNPKLNHAVHFYQRDEALVASLVEYCSVGLQAGDTCVVIATQRHLIRLNAALRANHVDVLGAVKRNQYLMYDANDMLATFLVGGTLDYQKLAQSIDQVVTEPMNNGGTIRAFGEMVALLWETGNVAAAIHLEEYWHDLVEKQSFSLYCAYPRSQFDGSSQHQQALARICSCHSLTI